MPENDDARNNPANETSKDGAPGQADSAQRERRETPDAHNDADRADRSHDGGQRRHYAKDAVDHAGRRMNGLKDRVLSFEASCLEVVSAHPGKSVLIAAALGALVATVAICAPQVRPQWTDRMQRRARHWLP